MTLSSSQVRYAGLGVLVLLIALMSIQGVVYISKIESDTKSMVDDHQADLEKVDTLFGEFVEIRGLLTTFVINEEEDIKPLIMRIDDLIDSSATLTETFHEERYQAVLEKFTQKMKEYKAAVFTYSQELLLRRTGEGIRSWERILVTTRKPKRNM